jgi:uncharacterized membrane protein
MALLRRAPITHTADTGRLEAFSDGVFAIAITLLILDIAVPLAGKGKLAAALVHLWPSYVAYGSSFFTIGIMWMNHHFLFGLMKSTNRPLILLNLALLAVVAFMPFPTALLAEYLKDGSGANLSTAVAFYGSIMLLLTAAFTGMWVFVRQRVEMTKDASFATYAARRSLVYCAISIFCYLVAIGLAFALPFVSLVIYVLVAVMFLTGRLSPRASAAS